AASMGGTVPAMRAGVFRMVTGSPSLEEQPRTAASRSAGIVLFITPILRNKYQNCDADLLPGERVCHILTRGAAILRVKGSPPSLLEAESASPDSAFFISPRPGWAAGGSSRRVRRRTRSRRATGIRSGPAPRR